MTNTRPATCRRFVATIRQFVSRSRRHVGLAAIGATTMAVAPAAAPPALNPATDLAVNPAAGLAPGLAATGIEAVASSDPSPGEPGLPGARHPRIDFWRARYSGGQREAFERQMHRRSRYEALILEKLAARGLPPDLIYLAWIESGFLDTVESHAGAVGLWQFMPATARGMGLRVDDVVDERRDPVRSTEAAAAFLHRLHRRYGSWHLAMAAYNGGPTRVSRIARRHGTAPWGHESLYWQVLEHLPVETAHYVPRFLAVRALARELEAEGFEVAAAEPYTYSLVWLDRSWTFDRIAEATGIAVETLRDLNPHLIADRTPVRGPYPLRVPVGSSIRVVSRLAQPDGVYALADD